MNLIMVGGGEIGRPGTKIETLKIDKEIIALSEKRTPKLLFIPTASRDSQGYVTVIEEYFGKKLGCDVDSLRLYGTHISKKEIKKKITWADVIYVGGGNTFRMMRMWRKKHVDKLLTKAAGEGKVLAGVSAGAVSWCRYGNSDSRKMINPRADYIRVRGLDIIPLFLVPHFDVEPARQASVKKMLKGTKQVAVGLDNCSAVIIKDQQYRIVSSRPFSRAYRCYWKKDEYFVQKLITGEYRSISELYRIS